MFDYHLHSSVSFDSSCDAKKIVLAAENKGLKEICFTDHYDFNDDSQKKHDIFDMNDYILTYDNIFSQQIIIKHGVEFGLTHWNQKELETLLTRYNFDFVLGSVHFTGGYDPYYKDFWVNNGIEEGFEKYLLQTLKCVEAHSDFDVLGHINYVCKSEHNPTKGPLRYNDYSEICDEIMKVLVHKGKGMEINTSGKDRVGEFLPAYDFIKRFKELGGEIITVGSDSHDNVRVGQYIPEALDIVKEIFGYVCTFDKRKVIFNKL